jgi:hypothetical protein
MWTRIISIDQLKTIGIGTLLLKYPVIGEPSASLDINDKERISIRFVTKNFPSFEEFDISLIPFQVEHFVFVLTGLSNLSFAAMHKKYRDIVMEGNYWIFGQPNEIK